MHERDCSVWHCVTMSISLTVSVGVTVSVSIVSVGNKLAHSRIPRALKQRLHLCCTAYIDVKLPQRNATTLQWGTCWVNASVGCMLLSVLKHQSNCNVLNYLSIATSISCPTSVQHGYCNVRPPRRRLSTVVDSALPVVWLWKALLLHDFTTKLSALSLELDFQQN